MAGPDDDLAPLPRATDVADLLTRAAAENPDKLAIVEAGGRTVTWAELDDEVGRLASGLGAAGIVAGHRVMIVLGNRLEFVASYLGILRAQAVAVPVNPTATSGELARMIADSGSRIVIADADAVSEVRGAIAALDEAMAQDHPAGSIEADLFSRLAKPRVVVVGATLQPGRALLRPPAGRAGARRPAAAGPREARRPPLHERHVRPPARRDAHPPRAARQHRAGRGRRPADDPRRRRRARRAAALPRLRAQRRARRRAAPPGQGRARRRGSTRRAPST